MSKIICFSGTHSTGKTTAVLDAAAALKRLFPNCRIGVVHETAELCPFGALTAGNPRIDLESQLWIFSAQICAELEAIKRYDITVTDRSVVDPIGYTYAGGFKDAARGMLAMAKAHIPAYSKIFFMPATPKLRLVDNGFRNTDEILRMEVQKVILGVYRRLNCELSSWRGAKSLDGLAPVRRAHGTARPNLDCERRA